MSINKQIKKIQPSLLFSTWSTGATSIGMRDAMDPWCPAIYPAGWLSSPITSMWGYFTP